MMTIVLFSILCVLFLMGSITIINIFTFGRVRNGSMPRSMPMVSVLIPARNEAERIATCLAGLVNQSYPHVEVIVLDDRSEDVTADIVQHWETCSSRVRLVRGEPLPAGWVGKCHACRQLAGHARGELLLFTDADTEHTSGSVAAAVAAMERSDADLLSLLPQLRLHTFWERAVMPLLYFVTFTVLPFALVRSARSPKLAMANGQFMLFRRTTYDEIGGHASVRDALVEDVWLARRVKEHGRKLVVMDGVDVVATRMYRSFREIWEGFSKNLFPGFNYSLPAITVAMVFNLATSVIPFAGVAMGLFSASASSWLPLALGTTGVIVAIRLMLAYRFGLHPWYAFTHPIGMAVVAGIAFNSVHWALSGIGLRWKGRAYQRPAGVKNVPGGIP
jgi:chlorobactene glucosyltransferase